jgi:hypothetical protein
MKINRKTLSLIIASLCGTSASALVGQEYDPSTQAASSGRIGDTALSASDPRVGSIRSSDAAVPFSEETLHPVSFHSPEFNVPGSMESTGVYSDFQSSSCSPCGTASVCNLNSGLTSSGCGWVETEALLWWGKGITGTPTILSGTSPTALPSIPIAGGEDNPLGTNMFAGMRVTAGKWLDNDKNYGLMGRVFGLLSDGGTTTVAAATAGNPNSTGIGYFDTFLAPPGPAVYLANIAVPGFGANTGTITVANDLDLIAADASIRTLLIGDSKGRVDLLGGYSFLRLDSSYGLTSSVTNGITGDGTADGTVTTISDSFRTKNTFHGGHLGLMNELSCGRFTFSMTGKVAMGNMNQTSIVSGSRQIVTPNVGTTTSNRGFFAQPGNIGTISRDRFTFVPEAGAKMKYQLGRGQLGVGYTLLVLPNVAMAADQINLNVDPIVGTTTAGRFATDTFFLHGLDLGYTMKF